VTAEAISSHARNLHIAVWLVVAVWLSGNIVGCINEVTLHRAGLVLRWVTIRGYTIVVSNQATLANSAFHPSGVGNSSTGLLGWGEGGACSPVSCGR